MKTYKAKHIIKGYILQYKYITIDFCLSKAIQEVEFFEQIRFLDDFRKF